VNLNRRSALNVAATVMLMVPVWLAAADTKTEETGSAAKATQQRDLASDRPAYGSLLALGFCLALAAHTMKRRNP
jgi:hypothetical protein